MTLTAPFPWYGGKRKIAPLVWDRFGDVGVYVEPFAGSLAVLLHRESPAPREIVCDTDGGICNFWRAVRADPEEVAYWADYPTIHQDLTARHRWLVRWVIDNAGRLEADPEYFDARAAGWWVWGISLWIGGGWCQPEYRDGNTSERRPLVSPTTGGNGINAQAVRGQRPHVNCKSKGQGISAQTGASAKRPYIADHPSGRGVSAQRLGARTNEDNRPRINPTSGGMGVSAQRHTTPWEKRPMVGTGNGQGCGVSRRASRPDIVEWFERLAERLHSVIVLNRSWESAVTPTVLQHTPSGPKPPVAIFMDPPYLREERAQDIYGSDAAGTSSDVARASWEWARAHGDRYRIAYCCHDGDFDIPDGWTSSTSAFSGIRRADRRHRRDLVVYSPACIPENQSAFDFDDVAGAKVIR